MINADVIINIIIGLYFITNFNFNCVYVFVKLLHRPNKKLKNYDYII